MPKEPNITPGDLLTTVPDHWHRLTDEQEGRTYIYRICDEFVVSLLIGGDEYRIQELGKVAVEANENVDMIQAACKQLGLRQDADKDISDWYTREAESVILSELDWASGDGEAVPTYDGVAYLSEYHPRAQFEEIKRSLDLNVDVKVMKEALPLNEMSQYESPKGISGEWQATIFVENDPNI